MKKIVTGVITLAVGIFVVACSPNAGNQGAEQSDAGITVAQVEEIATSQVENGVFRRLEVREYDGVQVYSVTVESGENTYEVVLNAQSGDLVSLERLESASSSESDGSQAGESDESELASESVPDANSGSSNDENAGSATDRSGSSASTSGISRDQASQIAQNIVSGTLIEVDNDMERGRAVWYVAIRNQGRIHEIYVDRSTGEIVLHESEVDD